MSKFEEELILKLSKKIEENENLKNEVNIYKKEYENMKYDQGVCNALLADVCEQLFGTNAKNAPTTLADVHGSWIFGPITKINNISFYQYFLKKQNQEQDKNKEILEWNEFLKTLSKNK